MKVLPYCVPPGGSRCLSPDGRVRDVGAQRLAPFGVRRLPDKIGAGLPRAELAKDKAGAIRQPTDRTPNPRGAGESMWDRFRKVGTTLQGESVKAPTGPSAHPNPSGALVCCGQPMEPRLAQARDRYGQTMFVAVWRCPRCGRMSY